MKGDRIVASGNSWVMVWVEPVLVTQVDASLGGADFEAYLHALAADIDEWPRERRRSVLYDVPVAGNLDAEARRRIATVLDARRDKLGAITAGYAFATGSSVVRGIMKVLDWLSPPPYPTTSGADVRRALTALKTLDGRVDPPHVARRYAALLAQAGR